MNQKQLNNDLKQARRAKREMINVQQSHHISNIMKAIENHRKRLVKSGAKQYTPEYVAESAGISLATYETYIYLGNDSIKLKTILNLATVFGKDCSPILELFDTPDTK